MTDPVAVTERKSIPEVQFRTDIPGRPLTYQPTLVRMYGIRVNHISVGPMGPVIAAGGARAQPSPSFTLSMNVTTQDYALAVIYAYSYEGHCYSLPKPCLVVVDTRTELPVNPQQVALDIGCGYQGPYHIPGPQGPQQPVPIHYSMWTADKLDRTLLLSLDQGFIEDIILAQNVAGPKAPAAYSSRAVLAHRGGKLSDY
jgi:hypothetical protein